MDITDFSHKPTPEVQNTHIFLKILSACPPETTDEQITAIATGLFGSGFFKTFNFSAHEQIFKSATILMYEVGKMKSLSDAQTEIAGAVNGLNILLRGEKKHSRQMKIKGELYIVGEYAKKIDDIFLIKKASDDKQILNESSNFKLIEEFGALISLYGRDRRIEAPLVRTLSQALLKPNIRLCLNNFARAIDHARYANLKKLSKGQIPILKDRCNRRLLDTYKKLISVADPLADPVAKEVAQPLGWEEYKNFKPLIDDLFHNRAMVTNTQIHTEGLNLAFKSRGGATIQSLNLAKGVSFQHREKQQLIEKLESGALDQKTFNKEIEILQNLEGYCQRSKGFYYEKSLWEPLISITDPIQPITRIIGFATREGNKRESSTSLDFTKALGKDNLNLTFEERSLLSELLNACDSAVREGADVMALMRKENRLPQQIAVILKKFNKEDLAHFMPLIGSDSQEELTDSQEETLFNNDLPHLEILTDSQKEALVNEALRFAFEVNYHLADDLLGLSNQAR